MRKCIIIGIINLILLTGMILYLSFSEPEVFITIKSPAGTHAIELLGDESTPDFPFIQHYVGFNLYQNGQKTVSNGYIYSGDCLDRYFDEKYRKYHWLNESILQIGWSIRDSESSPDSLIVSNKTDEVVKYLKIDAEDMIFAFDLKPGESVRIEVPRQTVPYVSANGEFVDGRQIERKGVNFILEEKAPPAIDYCLSVVDGSIRIESTTLIGYTGHGGRNHTNPDVPKVPVCH